MKTKRKNTTSGATNAGDFTITKIDRHSYTLGAWVLGTIAGHCFQALVFADHAAIPDWEIGQSRITKLRLQRIADKKTVYNWDRGRDVISNDETVVGIVEFLYANLANRINGTGEGAIGKRTPTEIKITEIANEHFGLATLERRNSDRLDFFEVAVWQIAKALDAAYRAGQEDAKKRPQRK